jgi:hypothetical protein
MNTQTESYNAILKRMSDLSDLTAHVETIAKSKNDQSESMMKLITSMSGKINLVRENVDKIRAGSVEIGNRIKDVIKSSEDSQKANLLKIKNSITQLGNVNGINIALQGLDKDINLLVQKAVGGPSSNAPAPPPQSNGTSGASSVSSEEGATSQEGGYTYGMSIKKGKGRRRRARKTRRKRAYKKLF